MSCEYCNHDHAPDPFFCIARLQEDHEQAMNAELEVRKVLSRRVETLEQAVKEKEEQVSALTDVHKDHNRLVRDLDVAINGREGAAKQASLCDIVSQMIEIKADNCRQAEEIAALKRIRERGDNAFELLVAANEQIAALKAELEDWKDAADDKAGPLESLRQKNIKLTTERDEQIATLKAENLNLYEASKKTITRQAEEIKAKSEYINTLHLLISNHSQNCRGWFTAGEDDAWEAMIKALTKTEVK